MAVFRVERNKGYTVMSNHHLRNKELTLKAKGLLSQMLSLPEDWDYTLAGLSQINRESIDAIRTAVWELEKAGYIKRQQGRDEKGKMTAIEYTIYEQPQPPDDTPPGLDKPILENPTPGNPILENPTPGKPTTENPMQLNKDIQRTDLPTKEKRNTDLQSTYSIPIHSPNPSPLEQKAATPPERKRKEADAQTAFEIYREIIKDNISYKVLGKTVCENYKTKSTRKTAPEEQHVFEGAIPAIVDGETWQTVQKIRETVRRAPKRQNAPNRLTGLLYCADCGSKLTHRYNLVQGKWIEDAFVCSGYRQLTHNSKRQPVIHITTNADYYGIPPLSFYKFLNFF